MTGTATDSLEAVRQTLRIFLADGQVSEIRAFGPKRGEKAIHATLYRDHDLMARQALAVKGASGVYFVPNPLREDLIPPGKKSVRGSANAGVVLSRRWLLIDVDPVRFDPDGAALEGPASEVASTLAERDSAWEVLTACRALCDGAGFSGPVIGDSGSGFHLCYPIDLPNDQQQYDAVAAFLAGLQERCGGERALIDQKCKDAPRVWKLYGTLSAKGKATEERPHRTAQLIEGEPWAIEAAQGNNAALVRLLTIWDAQARASFERKQAPPDAYARACIYLKTCEPAVSGQRGHDKLMWAARVAVLGFDLGQTQGAAALQEAYNPLCRPSWSDGEIAHKCREADEKPFGRPRGWLLNEDRQQRNGTHQAHDTGAPGSAAPPPQPFPPPVHVADLVRADESRAWLWKGFLARGEVTLFSALWKAGKTTLLAHLLKTLQEGGDFCGHAVQPGKVLYVTEESESRWAQRRDEIGLAGPLDFVIRPFSGRPKIERWEEFLAWTRKLVIERSYDLVVCDTLANLWPVKDENDAALVQAALMPLHQLVADQASVMLVHHTRKSDGPEATAARGSGALSAFVDTILEFRRFQPSNRKDRKRVLTGYGRHDETPAEIVVELTGNGYVCCGDRESLHAQDIIETILGILPAVAPGLTAEQITDLWPDGTSPRTERFGAALRKGVEDRLWHREGAGKKGSPYTYWLVGCSTPF